jgi:hypothetical protein
MDEPASEFGHVLRAEAATLGYVAPDTAKHAVSEHIVQTPLPRGPSGLALSGGGIRSATFCLGVIQALASARKLGSFDYLSTVSGGGYIGSWLSAWIRRSNLREVETALSGRGPVEAESMRTSEPEEIAWLRRYSNYLAPKIGLLSMDSLTLGAVWLRNVFLNLVVVVSFIVAMMLVPKALIPSLRVLQQHGPALANAAAYLGLLVLPIAISCNLLHMARYSDERQFWLVTKAGVLLTVLLPGTLAALAGSIWLFGMPAGEDPDWMAGAWATALLLSAGGIFWMAVELWRGMRLWVVLKEALVFAIAGVIAIGASFGVLVIAHAIFGGSDGVRQIATLLTIGPPAFLFAFAVGGSIFVGLVGRVYFERSREWWGRMNSSFFIVGLGWLGMMGCVFFVPAWTDWAFASSGAWIKTATSLGWIGSLIASLVTAKASNLSKSAQQNIMVAVNFAAYVFIIGFLILISSLTDRLLLRTAAAAPTVVSSESRLSQLDLTLSAKRSGAQAHYSVEESAVASPNAYVDAHMSDLEKILGTKVVCGEVPLLYAVFAGVLGILGIFGWRVDVNKFSLHNMYKNRLIRCYLGASNPHRNEQPFTGFDERDDLPLSSLGGIGATNGGAQRPFHIINTTLNLSQGKNLAWQERKGASFILSPRYCGFSLSRTQGDTSEAQAKSARIILRSSSPADSAHEAAIKDKVAKAGRATGYRPTTQYASRDDEEPGFTLGMAMATSGAAASPNMGPATRPALAFVMTLFNARLGRWSPNPVMSKWRIGSPRFGILCLFAELFGLSDEESSFVYLSDGGHFDNLGVYELVRRRCSTIWVVDAAADASRTFEELGRTIRQCRIDFGVEIDVPLESLASPTPNGLAASGFVGGTIDYGPGRPPGRLIYLKPTLCAGSREPDDIIAYGSQNPSFPQQSTADQFFDESQFESYRRLGLFIGAQCVEKHGPLLPPPVEGQSRPPDNVVEPRKPHPRWVWFVGAVIATVLGMILLQIFRPEYTPCGSPAADAPSALQRLNIWSADVRQRTLAAYAMSNLTLLTSAYAGGSQCVDPDIDHAKGPTIAPGAALSKVGLSKPTAPQIWLWIDNVFIVIYSSMFVLGYLCVRDWNPTKRSKQLFCALALLAAAGAMADYIENFILLGGLSSGTAIGHVAREAAPFTDAKFLFFGANFVVLAILLLHVAIRRRTRRI